MGSEPHVARAVNFLCAMAAGRYEEAAALIAPKYQDSLRAENLHLAWLSLAGENHPLLAMEEPVVKQHEAWRTVDVPCHFTFGRMSFRVVLDTEQNVCGLWKLEPAEEVGLPEYVQESRYSERDVTVGAPGVPLPGKLAVPHVSGQAPGVVIAHGSGPVDMDGTVGCAKPYRDIALGLASRGVAALRFSKRTAVYAEQCASVKEFTVKEELIEDVCAALSYLAREPGVDGDRLFLVAHSLGAMLVPRIAQEAPRVAGYVLMGAPVSPMEDLLVEQISRQMGPADAQTDAEKALLEGLKRQCATVKSETLSPATAPAALPLGVPASYWLDLRGYNPVEAAFGLETPLLILQGARDTQVPLREFEAWKTGLLHKPNVRFKLYDSLNHLFALEPDAPAPVDWAHVSEEVVIDIFSWISAVARAAY